MGFWWRAVFVDVVDGVAEFAPQLIMCDRVAKIQVLAVIGVNADAGIINI